MFCRRSHASSLVLVDAAPFEMYLPRNLLVAGFCPNLESARGRERERERETATAWGANHSVFKSKPRGIGR